MATFNNVWKELCRCSIGGLVDITLAMEIVNAGVVVRTRTSSNCNSCVSEALCFIPDVKIVGEPDQYKLVSTVVLRIK